MLGSCLLMQAIPRLLEANPHLILASRSEIGLLFGSTYACERGNWATLGPTWEAKNGQKQLGIRTCQLEREKMGHVGLLLAYASHPKAPGS